MKAGRPHFHVKAKWITLQISRDFSLYIELDKKGNIKLGQQDLEQIVPAIANNETIYSNIVEEVDKADYFNEFCFPSFDDKFLSVPDTCCDSDVKDCEPSTDFSISSFLL